MNGTVEKNHRQDFSVIGRIHRITRQGFFQRLFQPFGRRRIIQNLLNTRHDAGAVRPVTAALSKGGLLGRCASVDGAA